MPESVSPDPAAQDAAAPKVAKRTRDSLFLLAKLRIGQDAAAHEVRVRNLSEGGLMAEYGHHAAVDTAVKVEVRGVGEVSGRVVWSEAGRLGIAFDQPIDPKLARKPVGKAKSAGLQVTMR